MPLGLVRLRTFRLSAWVTQCNINAGVHVPACGANVSLRDVTRAQMRNGDRECEWRHAPEACGGFWRFFKKSVELRLDTEREGSIFGAHRGQTNLWRVPHVLGGRWKSQNRKNVYLSPYVEEPLNSKVIKSFVPELRSRKCFSCFQIPMFYIYIYVMNILCMFRISVFGYDTVNLWLSFNKNSCSWLIFS